MTASTLMPPLIRHMIAKPIFLVGAERSGTTMLRLMLDHHSNLSWCSEFEYCVRQIHPDGSWPDLETYYNWLESHRVFRAHGFTIDRTLDYPHLVDSFLRQKRDRDNKSIVGGTCHRWFDRLTSIWPDARFIHLVRDGRDVARSCIGMGWAGNVWCGADKWIEAEQRWTKVSQTIPADRRIDVQSEQLVCDPESTLRTICDFLEVPFEPSLLAYDADTTYSKPDPKLTQQWKRKLNNRQLQLVESRITDLLTDRGYELSGLPVIQISASQQRRLKLQNWWACLNFRRKRYGFSTWLMDMIVRRLGTASQRKRMKLRINEINTKHLK